MGTEHAELSDSEIVFGYRKGEVPGQTVMRRLLEKCEKSAELADEVMKKSDGSIMTGPDGSPLVVDQYFTVAIIQIATVVVLVVAAGLAVVQRVVEALRGLEEIPPVIVVRKLTIISQLTQLAISAALTPGKQSMVTIAFKTKDIFGLLWLRTGAKLLIVGPIITIPKRGERLKMVLKSMVSQKRFG